MGLRRRWCAFSGRTLFALSSLKRVLVVGVLLVTGQASAATLSVAPGQSIQNAINAAKPGDEIVLAGLIGPFSLAGRLFGVSEALLATAMEPVRSASGPTPPRLSFIDGSVSFWRPGAEDWSEAQINTPLAAGDARPDFDAIVPQYFHRLEGNLALSASYIYTKGAHGMGLGSSQWDPGNRHVWTQECALWLKEQGFGAGIPRN